MESLPRLETNKYDRAIRTNDSKMLEYKMRRVNLRDTYNTRDREKKKERNGMEWEMCKIESKKGSERERERHTRVAAEMLSVLLSRDCEREDAAMRGGLKNLDRVVRLNAMPKQTHRTRLRLSQRLDRRS